MATEKRDTWITWTRGEWSGDLLGFRTLQERRDYLDGKPGPFCRPARKARADPAF